MRQVHDLGWQQVDYILELQNLAHYWSTIVALIKPLGTIVSTTGSRQPINLVALKAKQVKFAWEWVYAKSFYQLPAMISQHAALTQLSGLLDQGILKSTVTKVLSPISGKTLRQAHQLVGAHHMVGKVVITNNQA